MSSPLVGERLAGPEPRQIGFRPLFLSGCARASDGTAPEERRESEREACCREGERKPQHLLDIGAAGDALELSG
jgi:hypothetical protein